jgi:preprotein translocase subunit YajC
MEVNEVLNIISNVGFPIAVCVVLFYYMNKQNEKHKQEIDKLSETLQGNTKVLTELCTLIKTIVK